MNTSKSAKHCVECGGKTQVVGYNYEDDSCCTDGIGTAPRIIRHREYAVCSDCGYSIIPSYVTQNQRGPAIYKIKEVQS